ncbi:GAF domain-containing protein [Thermomicrobium sp. CFH 73360]|uniref:GAF domain-containing protein n=1 Tax=Thermomicrobium sp. CFH 73360 TaxID=2951987 RepID=UPI0020766A42|nr:GAF domain-containing protein [Thermomicrobium sp. CFH 73360]MCM8745483.1 GAF domain-containing protein [Thermomicrobium sp. CFH 73360]
MSTSRDRESILEEARRALEAQLAVGDRIPELLEEACRILEHSVPWYDWVGVYLVEGDELVLAAWSGPAATEHVRIPIGQGICGAAAREGQTIIVSDVREDPRYLQCFLSTRSEIVVPIRRGGTVIGEIDIDSDRLAAFDEDDRVLLEWLAERLAERLPQAGKTAV